MAGFTLNPLDPIAQRKRALDLIHAALFRGRMIAQERLEEGADGLETAGLLSAVMDEALSALYDFTVVHIFRAHNPTEAERMAVVAVVRLANQLKGIADFHRQPHFAGRVVLAAGQRRTLDQNADAFGASTAEHQQQANGQ